MSTQGTLTVAEGDDAVLECNATGSDGTFVPPCNHGIKLEWLVTGSTIASCSGINAYYTRHVQFDNRTGTLTIPNVLISDEGTFTCYVGSGGGFVLGTTSLTVEEGAYNVSVFHIS